MKEVVAAVINDNRGRLLIAQRPEMGSYPLKWHFVGGKVEATDGNLMNALCREVYEETGADCIGKDILYTTVRYAANETEYLIHYISAELVEGSEIRNIAIKRHHWATENEIDFFDWIDTDREVAHNLGFLEPREPRYVQMGAAWFDQQLQIVVPIRTMARILTESGYRRVSPMGNVISRIDNPLWRESVQKAYPGSCADLELEASFYLRHVSKDRLIVSSGIFQLMFECFIAPPAYVEKADIA